MTAASEPQAGILRVGPFAGFYQRFEELIGEFQQDGPVLHPFEAMAGKSRRRHQDISRPASDTTMEIFLPDLENHELMFSLSRRFEDGPLTPTLVVDAYRYCCPPGARVWQACGHLALWPVSIILVLPVRPPGA